MIISFTGTGSSGKSTLLNHLKEKNLTGFDFVEEVTRKVKREHGVEINEQGSDITQKLIFVEHLLNIQNAKNTEAHTIMDRCLFDLAIYTSYLREMGNVSETTFVTLDRVIEAEFNRKPYDLIFYTDPNDVELEIDGERSSSAVFRDNIATCYEVLWDDIGAYQPIVRLSGTVQERLETVKQVLASYHVSINI